MSNQGFNLKVRRVENGYTIHLTEVPEAGGVHKDFVAQSRHAVKETLEHIVAEQLDSLLED
jgi:hypothetical protein